jgi:hypothetical protein
MYPIRALKTKALGVRRLALEKSLSGAALELEFDHSSCVVPAGNVGVCVRGGFERWFHMVPEPNGEKFRVPWLWLFLERPKPGMRLAIGDWLLFGQVTRRSSDVTPKKLPVPYSGTYKTGHG